MKHLFVINPKSYGVKGRVSALEKSIQSFFKENPAGHEVHVTRWVRDASGYVHRYAALSDELLRVHVMGGSGTLYEVVNAIVGLPNTQLAVYPYGRNNEFLRYFGNDKLHLFSSIRNQVFSNTVAMDAIRSGNRYGIVYGMAGLEAISNFEGHKWHTQYPRISEDLLSILSALLRIFSSEKASRFYQVTMDGRKVDGDYISILIANSPCYGKNMYPAIDAHPNDGWLDVYLLRDMPKTTVLYSMNGYLYGKYKLYPDFISHHKVKRIQLSAEDVICMSVDGETFYEKNMDFEIAPYAIDFVCPNGVDIEKLPRVFGIK